MAFAKVTESRNVANVSLLRLLEGLTPEVSRRAGTKIEYLEMPRAPSSNA